MLKLTFIFCREDSFREKLALPFFFNLHPFIIPHLNSSETLLLILLVIVFFKFSIVWKNNYDFCLIIDLELGLDWLARLSLDYFPFFFSFLFFSRWLGWRLCSIYFPFFIVLYFYLINIFFIICNPISYGTFSYWVNAWFVCFLRNP